MSITPRFNTGLLRQDMEGLGWLQTDLARSAGVSDTTVMRFLRGEHQTARTAKKLASALGFSIRRYQLSRNRNANSADPREIASPDHRAGAA